MSSSAKGAVATVKEDYLPLLAKNLKGFADVVLNAEDGVDINMTYASGSLVIINGSNASSTLEGSNFSDSITGNASHDRLEGNDGNDTIKGNGNDTIIAGAGDDVIKMTSTAADGLSLRAVMNR